MMKTSGRRFTSVATSDKELRHDDSMERMSVDEESTKATREHSETLKETPCRNGEKVAEGEGVNPV